MKVNSSSPGIDPLTTSGVELQINQKSNSTEVSFVLSTAQPSAKKQSSESLTREIADQLETKGNVTQVEMRISVDSSTKQMVVGIYNVKTNELIREIPPEKVREMEKSIDKLVGTQMDTRA